MDTPGLFPECSRRAVDFFPLGAPLTRCDQVVRSNQTAIRK